MRLEEENTGSGVSVKEEIMMPDSEDKTTMEQSKSEPSSESEDQLNYECLNNNNNECFGGASLFPVDLKDGSSDSDSSAILNEENNRSPITEHLLLSPETSSMNCLQFQKAYQAQYVVKMEEHNFFSADEACNFFSDEQAPTLQWWN